MIPFLQQVAANADSYCADDYCHRNVLNLLEDLKSRFPEVPLKKVKVLFLTPVNQDFLQVLNSKQGMKKWKYHVVLESDGKIVDLDLKPSVKQDLPEFKPYLKQMFTNHSIRVRAIPADVYRRNYRKYVGGHFRDAEYYLSPKTRYPVKTIDLGD